MQTERLEAKGAENLILISPMTVHSKLQQQISRVNLQLTWVEGHILRNDCPELVEEFILYTFSVFFCLVYVHACLLPM